MKTNPTEFWKLRTSRIWMFRDSLILRRFIEEGDINKAREMYQAIDSEYIVTRRSVPHGIKGKPAEYMVFPNMDKLYLLCKELGFEFEVQ